MPKLLRTLSAILALTLLAAAGPQPIVDFKPTVILISLDGFRASYLKKWNPPTLTRLAQQGAWAQGLISCFPSETFPNHYSMVTGLDPEKHGIVGNYFFDTALNRNFQFRDPVVNRETVWWEAEPAWILAERAGIRTAPLFWIGSQIEFKGVGASHSKQFDPKFTRTERLKLLFEWLDQPVEKRPRFLTLYMEDVDSAGHSFGPDSQETEAAVQAVDKTLNEFIHGLEERRIADKVDLIIVSDHGMMNTSPEKVIYLSDYVSVQDTHALHTGPYVNLYVSKEKESAVLKALAHAHPKMKVYRRAEVPKRFHYRSNPRIGSLVAIAEPGWLISVEEKATPRPPFTLKGAHGWDPSIPEMHGLFIANGPSFKSGQVLKPFHNTEIYPLLLKLLGLSKKPNSSALTQKVLKVNL